MENLIELNEFEMLNIEGGSSEEWGYRMGRALAKTVKQCANLFGTVSVLFAL
ncbi:MULTISPECIES: hypothetical protein [Flavobacterium]|uniref:hypothetical protein n=1 Tax=Flavobacterium TaxID=237 RepID=UPI0003454136|nr:MULTISPECIES: hypothetical protein [Flavobacterium]MDL2142914.1 hypothetical protein [Flavobacterium tructae]